MKTWLHWLSTLAARERTAIIDRQLGTLLAAIAGAINAGGFVAVGRYTSHMTGITATIANELVLHHFALALFALLFLGCFILGSVTAALIIRYARSHQYRSEFALPLMLEALLLMLFGLIAVGLIDPRHATEETIALLCFLMGLQNATITKLSRREIRTTHVTGTATDLGIEIGLWLYRHVAPGTHVNLVKLRTHTQLLCAFLCGGIVGAASFTWIGYVTVIPLAFILILIALAPIWQDIKE